MNHADFLLEILCEELPASHADLACGQLVRIAKESLVHYDIEHEADILAYHTPRRLVLIIRRLAESQADKTVELKGPPRSMAFTADGEPTKAGLGFARKMGVDITELTLESTDKGDYLLFRKIQAGRPTIELLPHLVPEWISGITFPRSIRWGEGNIRFSRPIRNILALYDDKVIPVNLDTLKATNTTIGHPRLLSTPLIIPSVSEYRQLMRDASVIIDVAEREQIISTELHRFAELAGGKLIEDTALVRTVARCSEYPEIIRGNFHRRFLELPRDVLITSMRTHQKFFAIEDAAGNLVPTFLHVIDNPRARHDIVIRGNEKVLTARLADAEFFFAEDRKKKLADFLPKTAGITFHEKLGSLADKSERVQQLIGHVLSTLFPGSDDELTSNAVSAAKFYKADLVTLMVGEFPELQGIMGDVYARLCGLSAPIGSAIREHYLPRFATDTLPRTPIGISLAIADKLDTLCGYLSIGLGPSGSEDPYALRRQAAGICLILLEHDLRINLADFLTITLARYEHLDGLDSAKIIQDVRSLISRRLETILASTGASYDTIAACMETGWSNPVDCRSRIEALNVFRQRADFEDLIVGFRRAARILPPDFQPAFSPNLLVEEAERVLYQVYLHIRPRIESSIAVHDYAGLLIALAEFKTPIDRLFDTIMIMCDNEQLRLNRLSLLSFIVELFLSFAQFTRIVISQDKDLQH